MSNATNVLQHCTTLSTITIYYITFNEEVSISSNMETRNNIVIEGTARDVTHGWESDLEQPIKFAFTPAMVYAIRTVEHESSNKKVYTIYT